MNFNLFTQQQLEQYTNHRIGEVKLGEQITPIQHLKDLQHRNEQFVILGIPENIGIKANYGASDAHLTWNEFLKSFLNIQANQHNHPEEVIVLGEFNTAELQQKAKNLKPSEDAEALGELVEELDEAVAEIIKQIIENNKIPIIIGGGHNNAFGIIKGVSQAHKRAINILNIDAHTDFRRLEHRHSGNGFSYAYEYKYLEKFAVFGLHKNYTPADLLEKFDHDKRLKYEFFEDLLHLTSLDKTVHFKSAMNFLDNKFGLEIDCDAIENFPSSAVTPNGFSTSDIRTFIKASRVSDTHYLHLCEASPSKTLNIGKALTYLVSDYIRTNKL